MAYRSLEVKFFSGWPDSPLILLYLPVTVVNENPAMVVSWGTYSIFKCTVKCKFLTNEMDF